MIIVHLGQGRIARRPEPAFVDRTVDAPLIRQRPRLRPERAVKAIVECRRMEKAHTGYKPGKLVELGNDQCRYAPGHDLVMCGAKVIPGKLWCPKCFTKVYGHEHCNDQRNDQRLFSK